jgi:hypothetical protein
VTLCGDDQPTTDAVFLLGIVHCLEGAVEHRRYVDALAREALRSEKDLGANDIL